MHVTDLQASCKNVVVKPIPGSGRTPCSHAVVVTSLEQGCYHLVTRLMQQLDFLQVVSTRLIQAARYKFVLQSVTKQF